MSGIPKGPQLDGGAAANKRYTPDAILLLMNTSSSGRYRNEYQEGMNAHSDEPENRLWLAVMIRAFEDAMWEDNYQVDVRSFVERYNNRAQARAFLRGRTDGFHLICDAAGLSPASIRRIARDVFGDAIDDPYTLLDTDAAVALLGDRAVDFVEP